jgi:hypothetical protein
MANQESEELKRYKEHCKRLGIKFHSEAQGTTEFVHPMGKSKDGSTPTSKEPKKDTKED